YMAVGFVGVAAAGARAFGEAGTQQAAPLAVVARGFAPIGGRPAAVILSVGAITAMLGVLLNLILGLSRVALAMGRRGDLPRAFARWSGGSPRERGAGGTASAQRAGPGAARDPGASGSVSAPSVPLSKPGRAEPSAPAPTAAI